ncbi:3-keto-5-aminohexanoate cleavage protein [Phyllobacterium zundukense]|uniref:3-keto-5-aminohexanoate cleavage protein n=1 Tax=Phyllobacterium zundukense TaxID=1867719 RepID=A0A2N9VYH7_9HYPH|nr:3-keto-5-aminohexanoate cleavage protein [Phyllobacterium zundukense]ATU95134.1 3-keto-5-aminohexanoate cleavage protein [Phyllobacterium zundukense]PIO44545.1 3-keto-5-aminohexanoate cleavage protein [Phyllobacterium zundukense]
MAENNSKVIITCAITGSIHTPSMSPYLPITPEQIAEQAIDAATAGAAMLHLHARDPITGQPTPDPEIFRQFVPRIRESTDAIIALTTGGSATMSLDERLQAPRELKPEMCSLNMGTMNFGIFPLAQKDRDWKHEWEKSFLESSRRGMFRNTFEDIERIILEMSENGTRFEFECYDIGHLYTLAYFLERSLVKPPLFIQSVVGILGGVGSDPECLYHMRSTADRLFRNDYQWSVLAAGRNQMRLGTMAALMGGHVRVGLEDNLWLEKGQLAPDNASQVTKLRRILSELGLETATPTEARQLLGIPVRR